MKQAQDFSFRSTTPREHVTGVTNLSMAMSGFAATTHTELPNNKPAPLKDILASATSPLVAPPPLPITAVYRAGQVVALPTLQRVALLEDSAIEAESITRLFEDNGYKLVVCQSGTEFLRMLETDSFDMVVLDWNVPDVTGIEVLFQLRNVMQLGCPVLMLTSRASEYDIVQALNHGADDYLVKPWKPFELLARVKALLRRRHFVEMQPDEKLSSFILDSKAMKISRNGKVFKLSNKEFLLAQLLLRHLGTPVARMHIVQTVWNGIDPDARTLDVHIARLRTKLGLSAGFGYRLSSIYGYGYRLEKLNEPETGKEK